MTRPVERTHLGLVVYASSLAEQNGLVREVLAPRSRACCNEIEGERWWFTRFDARGPHLFAVFTLAAARHAQVVEGLTADLETYWSRRPAATVDDDERRTRHQACRGKILCALDREPGLAPERTVRFFDHPRDGYPHHRIPDDDSQWPLVSRLTDWIAAQLAEVEDRPPIGAALQLLAAVDGVLREQAAPVSAYWRHHASTLLPSLDPHLESPPGAGVRPSPWHEVWSVASEVPPPFAALPELIALAGKRGWDSEGAAASALREMLHTALKQLGVPVRNQIPLVLHAWRSAANAGSTSADSGSGRESPRRGT